MNEINMFTNDYRFLSNFYPSKINYQGIRYPSTEHAYQASKVLNEKTKRTIAKLHTASMAKKYGAKVKLRKNWENIKDEIMFEILQIKFQKACLKRKLAATKNANLTEGNWWGDTYWGVCHGKGQNKLGKMLMKIRNKIKKEIPK